jgi:alpha-galactosidase
MRAERLPITRAGLSWASRGGKSAFAGGDWLIFDDELCGAHLGGAHLGFHMAHSGDHATKVERSEDGLVTLLGEAPQAQNAAALFAWAENKTQLTHAFHIYAREQARQIVPQTRNQARTRKVHFNTWEACAFDFDEARLIELANDAAKLGAERFVLDDGWFKGRRGDQAGLGDWTADAERFPDGLAPLIKHVKAQGMDFGLWVEPEMVSPDSDLYRAHPDWCLHEEAADRPTERNQLVLDLSKPEVFGFVLESIEKLLHDHDIAYLKWDHNRRLFPDNGAQADRFRDLLAKLRTAHPHVMIESCSSGGGRIDMSILGLCERFWPSDNNDPVERVRLMREWSRFLPLELLGNHVGPSPNPITGRRTDMDFRAKVALFGHMGIEADPGAMTEPERAVLAKHIALYKEWREVLHSGVLHQLAHPDPAVFAQMVVGEKRSLAVAVQTRFAPDFDAAPVCLAGLNPHARYRVTLPLPWSAKATLYLPNWQSWREGITLSGQALMSQGLALPLTHPETAWLIALERLPE